MSVLWRYTLFSYAKVFGLSVATFIAVLILAKFKEIARFTALSGSFSQTLFFVSYLIPTILPIALPLSALIASLLLFQTLSKSYELTALRASGLSLSKILAPLLFFSWLLSLVNFSISSELAPYCQRQGKALVFNKTSENPLLLLQRQNLMRLKHAFLDMKVKDDEMLKDFTLITYHGNADRLTLLSARKLWVDKEVLCGEDVAILSPLPCIIENQSSMSTSAPILSKVLKVHRPHINIQTLSTKMLRLHDKQRAAQMEICRRISLSLAVFTLTFLGCAFGIEEGRIPKRRNIAFAILLTLLILMSYLMGGEMKRSPFIASLALFLPHPFAWGCCVIHLYRIAKGRL